MSLAISIEDEDIESKLCLSDDLAGPSQTSNTSCCSKPLMGSTPNRLSSQSISPTNSPHSDARASTAFYKLLSRLEEETRLTHSRQSLIHHATRTVEKELWVEKYRPRKFTELLAIDSAHIEVLKWATQWRKHIQQTSKRGISSNKKRRLQEVDGGTEIDSFERSMLLIHGPPGLGKTTLAHVVAQAEDFVPLEINASDERSGEGVLEKIKTALGSNSLGLQEPGRPHLIIIDEIDGVAAGGGEKSLINFLSRLAQESMTQEKKRDTEHEEYIEPNNHEDENGAEKKSPPSTTTSKKRKSTLLTRPIICICNDLFVPALRPLRQAHTGVRVVAMRKPTATAIRQRLMNVCEEEGLQLENKATLELIDAMEGDVRACLHTLQFIAHSPSSFRGGSSITAANLREALQTATKDVERSTVTIYENIFHIDPRHRRHIRGGASPSQVVLEAILAHGEYERLAAGVFELYPHCKFFDDTQLSRVNKGLEWLAFLDASSTAAFVDEHMVAYQPYVLLKFHQLFSSTARPVFKFPRKDYEQHLATQAMREILRSYQVGLQQLHKRSFDRHHLLCERIPVVLRLITPPAFRTTNPQLMRAEEKARLSRLVRLMLLEGLSYRQVRIEDGTVAFVLEPPLEALATFSPANSIGVTESLPSGSNLGTAVSRNSSLNAVRQMIASEVELERIRKRERRPLSEHAASILSHSTKLQRAYAGINQFKSHAMNKGNAGLTNTTLSSVKKDFFGRPIIPKILKTDTQALAGELVTESQSQASQGRVWFKFNEGFTNAIRRPMRIRDLFTKMDKR